MEKKVLTNRATSYCFNEIPEYKTYVYTIKTQNKCFIIDTFCGPSAMEQIVDDLNLDSDQEIIIVNTHFHWDHIWGNCFFRKNTIIAHKLCKDLIQQEWQNMMKGNSYLTMGDVLMKLPNKTFSKKLNIKSENINIIYTPGHTNDCITVIDTHDNFLYVGDNLERPEIIIESPDIVTYIKTLKYYLTLNPKGIHAGHTLDITIDDVKKTIEYLKNFL
ncbi:MAG: MBL fold metallo-hydrolase [Bacteroidales bacterium]